MNTFRLKRNLDEAVYEQILSSIFEGKFHSGEQVQIERLCEQKKFPDCIFLKAANTAISVQPQTESTDVWNSATDILRPRKRWQRKSGRNFRENRW